MRGSWLALLFMLPALIAAVGFYLVPVVMTGVFAFTNMSTATGIRGGAYLLTEESLRDLRGSDVPAATLAALDGAGYVVDEAGLVRLEAQFGADLAGEVRDDLLGKA